MGSLSASDENRKVLVTGGAGYIGSHTCIRLMESGYTPVIMDNLSNAHPGVLQRIEKIAGSQPEFFQGDIRQESDLDKVFQLYRPSSVVHFAGLKAVGESVENPGLYHENNVEGSRCLIQSMVNYGVKQIVFSSSATVYGDPLQVPITESSTLQPTNPYGQTKLDVENQLRDLAAQDDSWSIALLRYFNPVGAHPSGLIGEDPSGIPNNLMPFISQVAIGRRKRLDVFGQDYPTVDGTGVRDYIHVQDLAQGNVETLDYLHTHGGLVTLNLGTGSGASVLEMVKTFERVNDVPVPYRIVDRRPGDIAECWADTRRAKEVLGWEAGLGLEDMCRDTWRWQQANPEGYR